MTECRKQMDMMPLPNRNLPFTEGGIIASQENGFECGWREALEWTLRTAKQLEKERAPISMNDVIQGELDGK